jgi:hypothetical protein
MATGFQIRRHGFKTAGTLMLSVIDDLLANGFTYCGTGSYQKPVGAAIEGFSTTLEAGPNVDPLNPLPQGGVANQAWRLNVTVYDNATAGIVVGPDSQLPNGGALPFVTNEFESGATTTYGGVVGPVGQRYSKFGEDPVTGADRWKFPAPANIRPSKFATQGFINRGLRVWVGVNNDPLTATAPVQPTDPTKDLSSAYPMSYFLSITPRGVFLSVWEGAASDVDGNYFSWMLVQRPVDRDTGATIVSGKAPVFCVASVGGQITRFVVRESDVLRATWPASATKDDPDTAAIINDKIQVAVSEDNQYVVSFPSRLNTPRYAYTYELDMIGYTSATVVSQNTEVPLTLYNEAQPRNYVAVHANQVNSNGMRIVALVKGGGIS